MKLVPKIEWKLQKLRKFANAQGHKKHANDAHNKDIVVSSSRAALKEQIIKSVAKDYLTQIEPQLIYEKTPKYFKKATKENFMYDGSFHEAVGSVLLLAEFFSVMPVKGVLQPHPKHLSFSWCNLRTWYSLAFIAATLLDLVLTMNKVLDNKITFNNIEPMIFRCSIIIVCMASLNLAQKWPDLMMQWYETEHELPAFNNQMEKRRLGYKIKLVTFVAMMLSLGEHLFSMLAIVASSKLCPITADPFTDFFLLANDEIFYVFSYSNWLAILGKVENVMCTFVWNYMDVFVMIISIGLSSTFKQLNANLMKFKGMQMPEAFWSERRIQYRSLCILCENMDNAISIITMVSYSNNLYFICVQLLKSLNQMPSFAHTVYFYYSLLFLFGRTMAVSLYTADVNDESKKPLRVLRCVPKESWCPEVKRFSEEISGDLVALSGMKFFHLTRKLILSVAGTIVTYELVLIQFHVDTGLKDCEK